MLADADDEQRRLAFIQLLVDEGAKDKLAAHRNGRRPINLFKTFQNTLNHPPSCRAEAEGESRLRKFEQTDKWNFCLKAAIIAANRRDHE